MLYNFLCICLLMCCVIACTSQNTDDSIFPVPQPVAEEDSNLAQGDNNENNNSSENLPEPVVECLPDFHGEYISGELDNSKSDYRRKRINTKIFGYYYTLALKINDASLIQIVLAEAAPGITPDLGQVITDEDILLVRLERLREPGIWDGVLVKNLTTNFSFDK